MIRSLRKKRRAYLLAETAVAGLLLGAAMVMTVKMLGWMAVERRSSERRGWAVQEAANAMEHLTALPFDALSSATARNAVRLSDSAGKVLPDASLAIEVSDDLAMKKVDIAIRWKGPSGRSESPVRLTAWVARKKVIR
ncbi:MAG: hypothetical protein JWN86_2776 [Planctomycetota bacterium]|nr:hypothetical protein [Planctomycetota bacterium]